MTAEKSVVDDPHRPMIARRYPEAMTVEIARDGNAIIALIGRDLQVGVSGVGYTVPQALRDLADAIEREGCEFPELGVKGGPVRVK